MVLNDASNILLKKYFRPYKTCKKENLAILDYLQKRSLHTDWCFRYDGPSWSMVFSLLILELFEFGYFGRGNDLRIRRINMHQTNYQVSIASFYDFFLIQENTDTVFIQLYTFCHYCAHYSERMM